MFDKEDRNFYAKIILFDEFKEKTEEGSYLDLVISSYTEEDFKELWFVLEEEVVDIREGQTLLVGGIVYIGTFVTDRLFKEALTYYIDEDNNKFVNLLDFEENCY